MVTDPTLASANSHALDLLRVAVVAHRPGAGDLLAAGLAADTRRSSARWTRLGAPPGTTLVFYGNRRARPVAWLVHEARVVTHDAALALVRGTATAPAFDPEREALVDEPPPGVEPRRADEPAVAVRRYDDDEIVLEAAPATTALLVTSELAYPGWEATVDGRQAALLVVNAGFRAVVVPGGRHEVRLRFRPASLGVGLALAAGGLLALGACGAIELSRRTARAGAGLPEDERLV
jgi:hypothetical protein